MRVDADISGGSMQVRCVPVPAREASSIVGLSVSEYRGPRCEGPSSKRASVGPRGKGVPGSPSGKGVTGSPRGKDVSGSPIGKGAPGRSTALRLRGRRVAPTSLRCTEAWPAARLAAFASLNALRQSRRVRHTSSLTRAATRPRLAGCAGPGGPAVRQAQPVLRTACVKAHLLGAAQARCGLHGHAFAGAWVVRNEREGASPNRPPPPCPHSRKRAKRQASVALPMPRGPASSQAWCSRPLRWAASIAASAGSWPSSRAVRHGGDQSYGHSSFSSSLASTLVLARAITALSFRTASALRFSSPALLGRCPRLRGRRGHEHRDCDS